MLTVSRSVIRQFHKLWRTSGLGKPSRTNVSNCVRLIADLSGLTLLAIDDRLSIALRLSGTHEPETLAVPVTCLAEACERVEGDVTFRQDSDRLIAAWTDRDLPVEKEYVAINAEKLPPIPPSPDQWSENPSSLLDALRDAMKTTDSISSRYALGCLQLNGTAGQIAATDAHQILIQRGFSFPWTECLLIPGAKIFESAVLPRGIPVQIGKTERQVHFRIGPWQIAFAIQTGCRFPDFARAIPDQAAIETTLRLDSADAEFLVGRLNQMPVEDEIHRPVTIELNGSVAVRSRRSSNSIATELLLSRSQRIGNQTRIATDRRYLRRAIDLGFSEIGISTKQGPAVCRDERREFVWAILEDGAIPATDQDYRVDSSAEPKAPEGLVPAVQPVPAQAPTVITRHTRAKSRPTPQLAASSPAPSRKPRMPKNPNAIPSEGELIKQLLDLRTQLRTIEQSIAVIARHLRARQKQRQLMKSTLASLKQLQTLDV